MENKLQVIEVKPNRKFELKNRKELLHPDVETYILEIEQENNRLWCSMLNDMVHHSELDELENKYADLCVAYAELKHRMDGLEK